MADLSATEILDIIKDLRKTPLAERSTKFANFAERYPMLYKRVSGSSFGPTDLSKLEYLLKQKEDIENGQKDVEKASVEVGQKFFDIYVGDKVPKAASDNQAKAPPAE